MKTFVNNFPFLNIGKGNLRLLLCLSLIFVIHGLYAQNDDSFISNGREIKTENFDREISRMMDDFRIPGLSLAIIEDNKIAYHHNYGVKKEGEEEKVNEHTVFQGCSNSKSYLVFVAHQLADEGKLDLDKPLYTYREHDRLQHDQRYKSITARMVLSHSSGIENWQGNNQGDTLEILSEPGSTYVYSGEGYNYLSLVIKDILKQNYKKYIKQRVIKPLGLENSYLRFKKKYRYLNQKKSPWNFAYGHSPNGEYRSVVNKWAWPASGNQFTAEDYAKLVIATFDTSHLSVQRIKELKEPLAKAGEDMYYGPGFELILSPNDTIIAQGGNNSGYKNWIFYSANSNRGFVFMATSDRGELIADFLNKRSAQLNIDPFINLWAGFRDQYPGIASDLIQVYDKEGPSKMFTELEKLQDDDRFNPNALPTLSYLFTMTPNDTISEKLLRYNLTLFPDHSDTYFLLGQRFYYGQEYTEAMDFFEKAKARGFDDWDMHFMMKKSQEALVRMKKRESNVSHFKEGEKARIEAEYYAFGKGIGVYSVNDVDGNLNVGGFDEGETLDYNLVVPSPGRYTVSFRLTSGIEENVLAIISEDKLIDSIEIKSTGGWQNWKTVQTTIELPAGPQRLRLAIKKGAIGLNWMDFSPQLTRSR